MSHDTHTPPRVKSKAYPDFGDITLRIDVGKLENVRQRGGNLVSRCPACAEDGRDKTGDHLSVQNGGSGPFACVVHPGPEGREHRKRIFELVGIREGTPAALKSKPKPNPAPPKVEENWPKIPEIGTGSYREVLDLQRLRNLPFNAGLEILIRRGILGFAEYQGKRCWIATDGCRRNAQLRRLDGGALKAGGRDIRGMTLRGSQSNWPIGAADLRDRDTVLIVEGLPDLLAAATAAYWETDADLSRIGFCFFSGAGNNRIHPDALPFFRGKRVRIFSDFDAAGRAAITRLYRQLKDEDAAVDVWTSDTPGEDLNDFISGRWYGEGWPEKLTPQTEEKQCPY